MRRLSLANLRAEPGRFLATALAVIVATTFLAGVLTLRDSVRAAIEASTETGLEGVDAAVLAVDDSILGFIEAPTLDEAILETVRAADGVAAADGAIEGQLAILGDDQTVVEAGMVGARALDPASLGPYRAIGGRLPRAAGEVAVDERTVDDLDLDVGDRLALATTDGAQQAELVGVVRWADQAASGDGGDVVVSPADAVDWLSAGRPGFDAILIEADEGVLPTDLARSVSDALTDAGDGVLIVDGDTYRRIEAGSSAELADLLGTGLQVFAYVALLVGAFIIANTFTITVTQRVREFALLRAMGATGRQIRTAVRTEALVLGFLASLLGWVLGVAAEQVAVRAVPGLSSLAGSDAGLTIRPISVAQVLISGTVVTLIAALVPAVKASRVSPLEAMRVAAVDRSGAQVARAVIGAGLGALALLALAMTVLEVGPSAVALLGPVCLVLGLVVGGPWLARRVGRALGRAVDPGRRPIGSLAVSNVARNPRRTASTASALLVGVFLVVFVTSAGGAVRDWIVAQLTATASADLTVRSLDGVLPPDVVSVVGSVDGVAALVEVEDGVAVADVGGETPVQAGDIEVLIEVRGLEATSGSLEGLGSTSVVLPDLIAEGVGVAVGDELVLTFPDGQTRTVTVDALVGFSLSSLSPLISADLVEEVSGELVPNVIEIRADDGRISEVRRTLEVELAGYSTVEVSEGSEIGAIIKDIFNAIIQSVNALLGVAVLIAGFGIVNTLVLSVAERTRELGLLRAVGMTRRQVAATIRIEAVVVSALGTLGGMAAGLLCGWALTRPVLADGDLDSGFSWPLQELVVIAAVGLLLGVVASLLPARRASRLQIVEAIAEE